MPAHARGPEPVDGCHEVDARKYGGETQDEGREDGQGDVGARPKAVGGVKGPARIGEAPSGEQRDHGQKTPG